MPGATRNMACSEHSGMAVSYAAACAMQERTVAIFLCFENQRGFESQFRLVFLVRGIGIPAGWTESVEGVERVLAGGRAEAAAIFFRGVAHGCPARRLPRRTTAQKTT
jgi:hypothetical protein